MSADAKARFIVEVDLLDESEEVNELSSLLH